MLTPDQIKIRIQTAVTAARQKLGGTYTPAADRAGAYLTLANELRQIYIANGGRILSAGITNSQRYGDFGPGTTPLGPNVAAIGITVTVYLIP
jgi:hypothetical protein